MAAIPREDSQPTVEDRLERRDLVPVMGTPPGPDESAWRLRPRSLGFAAAGPDAIVRKAFMDLQAQRISRAEFQAVVERTNKMRITPTPKEPRRTPDTADPMLQ